MVRVLTLQRTGALAESLGLAMQRCHLTMNVSERWITLLVDQPLAALSRRALRAGLLACPITQPLCPIGPLRMFGCLARAALLRTRGIMRHDLVLLR